MIVPIRGPNLHIARVSHLFVSYDFWDAEQCPRALKYTSPSCSLVPESNSLERHYFDLKVSWSLLTCKQPWEHKHIYVVPVYMIV